MRKPFSLDEFKRIYSKVPRLTVDLVVRVDSGVVLTLRRLQSWRNQWHLPGGTVLLEETVEQAVQNVAHEELGIKVKIMKPLGYIEYPSELRERGYGRSIGLAMLCDVVSGTLAVNDEASQVQVFKTLPENTIKEQTDFLKQHWQEIVG